MKKNLPEPDIQVGNVWVVIPCFNVATHIKSVIDGIGPEVAGIIAVNDYSTDSTLQILESLSLDIRIHILNSQKNLGVGGATKLGFEYAVNNGADIVVKIDGDGQMDPSLIPELIRPIKDKTADYTKGNRFINIEQVLSMPRKRLIGNIVLSFMTKLSSGYWEIFDPNNGFLAISSPALNLLPLSKIDNRYFFESDMLFRLHLSRAVVQDIPVPTIYGDEISGLNEKKAIFEFGIKHNRNFVKRILIEYYLRDFNLGSLQLPLGIILGFFGVIYGAVNFFHFHNLGEATPTGTQVLVAMSVLSSLNLLLSFFSFDIFNSPKKPIS